MSKQWEGKHDSKLNNLMISIVQQDKNVMHWVWRY